ncbi:prolyl oligopeptidase family protein [Corynebacterium sp. ES2775-CONJ]|uniref:prolyl oligopeptidase family serine peptidase n=1 Tax=Corynebacterium sp. ES2775-CONJ TaxID=2974029 RepID=UPI002166E756|nr:prolyl oligopeptidase family serine peptidase [Corynebacterium sp. ES2775-CONJ]MCS4489751.1 prolyl oligopeptidase family serine peptidase [Corynebacterium sp. ES2775-CONJ]
MNSVSPAHPLPNISTQELEPIDSPEALSWVATLNGRAAKEVDKKLARRILEAYDNTDRIAYVTRRGDFLYNFWRDSHHPRGIWRRTTLESYRDAHTQWEILIDVDALAHEDGENWVWKGVVIRREADVALVSLSRGGADAACVREFDLCTQSFVKNGFVLDEARSYLSWIDSDSLLVSTDFGPGSLTISGYPRQIRVWRRGEDISAAQELYSGEQSDLLVMGWADPTPGFERVFVRRQIDFYTSTTFVHTPSGLEPVPVPGDASMNVRENFLFVVPRTDFCTIPAGGLGVIDFEEFMAGNREFHVLFSPDEHTSLQSLHFSRYKAYITIMRDVSSSIIEIDLRSFAQRTLDLPQLTTARIISADEYGDEVWLSCSSFSQPDTLYRQGASLLEKIAQAPTFFDATKIETRQHWARSADGTQIPYFIVGVFDQPQPKPTLVYAYGGFEVSLTPAYSGARGIGWLEDGYYFVQPNLRGGGEFGPGWHNQATKENRYKVYEDHQAILDDLVDRGYSRPETTFVRGGSNGGLLSAVALTHYPEKIGGAVIQVPLTDMLRYHTLLAGASWMAEYGDPDNPEERPYLQAYSPLENVVPKSDQIYPPALVTTSTRDDRVHPAHARLFSHALIQAGQDLTYYENTEGGHAGAADNAQSAFMEALVYSWMKKRLRAVR